MRIIEYGEDQVQRLLFFQSTAQPWWGFEAAAEQLAKHFHVYFVVPDGHHPEDTGDFLSVEQTVADVTAWLNARGIRQLDALYGLSMGGSCAMRFLAEQRIPVARAIIDGGIAPYPYPAWVCKLICVRDFLMIKAFFRSRKLMEWAFPPKRFTPQGVDPVESYDRLMAYLQTISNKTVWQVFWSANNYAMPAPAAKVNTKMIFWYGADEKRARAKDVQWAKAYFPEMAVKELPKMAHGEFVLVHPRAFAAEAMGFFRATP